MNRGLNTRLSKEQPPVTTPPAPSRFVVGIDLGTTNCALAYVDTLGTPEKVQTFLVPQLVASGVVEKREILPSFHYEFAAGEAPAEALKLPWSTEAKSTAVGVLARDQGTHNTGRLISSAKSWLCHHGVDRTAPILPWQSQDDVTKLSPVTASSRYLEHYRQAWDAQFPEAPLAEQEIVITLPASFDEIARELTVKAAREAGLPRVTLIEEPQAAFYAWIERHRHDWKTQVHPGQKILVIDVGGGTSDFTLIRVRSRPDGLCEFHRVAVGQHLILGGDNLDLALAHFVEQKYGLEEKLSPREFLSLIRKCRVLKESLLGTQPPAAASVVVSGGGSKLLTGSKQYEVTQGEAQACLVDGFFPVCELTDRPSTQPLGFREFGLAYAADAAITRYLGQFLTQHRETLAELDRQQPPTESMAAQANSDPACPDLVLFNGGVFESPVLKERVLETLRHWFCPNVTPEVAAKRIRELDHGRLDLAVAQGAAYFGLVRRGQGIKIVAGLARSYYLQIGGATEGALCVLPAGIEPGTEIDLSDKKFLLRLSQPVEFPLFCSSTRLTDAAGKLIPLDREQLTPLPPIRTVLKSRREAEATTVIATLSARLTELGTLDLSCREVDGPRSWKLAFDVRSVTRTDLAAHSGTGEQSGVVDEGLLIQSSDLIRRTFATTGPQALPPRELMPRLSETLELSREAWPPVALRSLWASLMEVAEQRAKSPAHEARWLNLAGFSLRPGYGVAIDDWRVQETWKSISGKLGSADPQVRVEVLILWRRISGGLSAGTQLAIATPLLTILRSAFKRSGDSKKGASKSGPSPHELAEMVRLFGAFEQLPRAIRGEVGSLVERGLNAGTLPGTIEAGIWALGRLGQRAPVYGSLDHVLESDKVERYLSTLMTCGGPVPLVGLSLAQIARKTGDRYRDLSSSLREEVAQWLRQHGAGEHLEQLVLTGGEFTSDEAGQLLGDQLPPGLTLIA
ncbi:MAG: molecular chaperone DnaK [Planctomyces sp.]|nr:molecular chaperone DnaK [Planctomyces sp.]